MARLYYMSLPGVGPWDAALKEVGAQLKPYVAYLMTAKKAAQQRKPVLGWRRAEAAEVKIFDERMQKRYADRQERAKQAQKRRYRRAPVASGGTWIVLEPTAWRPEEPDDTFEAFYVARETYDVETC